MKCICSKCEKTFEYKGKNLKSTCPHCGHEDYVEITAKLFMTRKERALQFGKVEFDALYNYKKAYINYKNANEIDNECCYSLMRMLISKLLLSNDQECYIKEVSEELENKSENIYLDQATVMYLKDALSQMRKFILEYLNSLSLNINNEDNKLFVINAYNEGLVFFNEYVAIYNGIGDLSQYLNEPLDVINEDIRKLKIKIKEIENINNFNDKKVVINYAVKIKKIAYKRFACLLTTAFSFIVMIVGFIMLMANFSLVVPASIIASSGILLFVISYSLAKHFKKKLDKFKII